LFQNIVSAKTRRSVTPLTSRAPHRTRRGGPANRGEKSVPRSGLLGANLPRRLPPPPRLRPPHEGDWASGPLGATVWGMPGGLGTPDRRRDADEEAYVHAPSAAPRTSGMVSAHALAALAKRQSLVPLPEVKARALDRPTPPNGREALNSSHIAVVAEVEAG